MSEITWGPAIPVNGKRPEWLRDDVQCCVFSTGKWWGLKLNTFAKDWCWHERVTHIRLPADHFAYTAIDKGFEPWGGGDEAPADWDGGVTLFRDGGECREVPGRWNHFGIEWDGDIIGYRKKGQTMTAANDIPAELVERMVDFVKYLANADRGMSVGETFGPLQAIYGQAAVLYEKFPKPVDPEKEAVRKLAKAGGWPMIPSCSDNYSGWDNLNSSAGLALACFRAGREYERENG